jgi:hypothetical protein
MSEGREREPAKGELEEALDADGRLRPRFVLDFPKDPELLELVELFERGDFRALRMRAPELATRTEDAVVRAACQELLRRIQPDPTVKVLLALALAFFGFLLAWAYLH